MRRCEWRRVFGHHWKKRINTCKFEDGIRMRDAIYSEKGQLTKLVANPNGGIVGGSI